jgi:protein-tyrosine phosphatase
VTAERVATKLWQGSVPKPGVPLPYDVVVLCAEEHQFDPRVYGHRPFGSRARVIRVPLTDMGAPLSPRRLAMAFSAAADVAGAVLREEVVLTTCAMGLNRSGLVNALALMEIGVPVLDAIAAIRLARPGALSNPHFVALLHGIAGRPMVRFPPIGGRVG